MPLFARAVAAYRAGAWADAERLCREILTRNAGDVEAMQLLGVTLSARGDLGGAEAILRSASALAPGNARILSSLGNVLLVQGNYEQARGALNAALAIDPRMPWALHAMGNLLTTSGELKQAHVMLERAFAEADFRRIRIEPDSSAIGGPGWGRLHRRPILTGKSKAGAFVDARQLASTHPSRDH